MHISMKSLSVHCCIRESDVTLHISDFCIGRVVREEKRISWTQLACFEIETECRGVVVVFDLFPYPVNRFLHFKRPASVYLFITAVPWKRWETLGKLSSFRGISLPARLERAICRKALGKNTEFEIHYSAPMRFILKNLYVRWPWLEKW